MTTALTPSDLRAIARKAADYITFHCDGLSRGFEITHKGYIAVSYTHLTRYTG